MVGILHATEMLLCLLTQFSLLRDVIIIPTLKMWKEGHGKQAACSIVLS